MSLCKTMDKFHFGMGLELLGLSLYKLTITLAISTLVLMFSFEFPKVSSIAVLYPSMVEGHLLSTLKRYQKKLQISLIGGFLKSTCSSVHHL